MTAVEFVEPAGQKNPCVHGPSHVGVVRTVVAEPNEPAEQGAVQLKVLRPGVAPYVPARQSPSQLALVRSVVGRPYLPAGHGAVHVEAVSPDAAPNVPPVQSEHVAGPVKK